MKISITVTETWHIQECSEKFNQRGILRKREQLFLCMTRVPDLIDIPINSMKISLMITKLWCIQERLETLIKEAY